MSDVEFDEYSFSRTQLAIDLACQWTRSIGNRDMLANVLVEMANTVHADMALVIRKDLPSGRRHLISCHNSSTGKLLPVATESRSDTLLNDTLFHLRPGVVHRITDLLQIEASSLHQQCGYSEITVCVLSKQSDTIDFVEFQFDRVIAPHNFQLLQIQAPAISKTWVERENGSVRNMLAKKSLASVSDTTETTIVKDILGVHNPAKLTRSEFRICTLIQQGALPADLRETLGISLTTYRSHMRSIYLKTGAAGQLELVHTLHQNPISNNSNAP